MSTPSRAALVSERYKSNKSKASAKIEAINLTILFYTLNRAERIATGIAKKTDVIVDTKIDYISS